MKLEERTLFETLLATHPDFLRVKSWVEGPEPPDAVVTDVQGRTIGVELTEWLTHEQATPSITIENRENEMLTVLDSESHLPPKHFAFVQVYFRRVLEFPRGQEATFCQEFYDLISYIDESWEREMARNPQKLWNDFSKYPTLGKQVVLLDFIEHATSPPIQGTRWVLGTGKGGAYDPRQSTTVLLDRIGKKKRKYPTLKADLGLAELVLLVHYGMRGLIHNSPIEGVNWKLDDHIREARADLAADHGHFDRAFLYLAYNEGQLFTLYS